VPLYGQYKKKLFFNIVDKTPIVADFEAFRDTSIYERYMLNTAQFSAAKSVAENKLLKEQLYGENGVIKGFSEFKKDAKATVNLVNETWFRTEYDTAKNQSVSCEQFRQMRSDKDLYPYWEYLHTHSQHPREDHLKLVGLVFRIGDPEGDKCHPTNGFNCACGSEVLDDLDLQDRGLRVLTNAESKDYLEKEIDPQFRFNSADQGILPKEGHSYFQALKSANSANYKTFGLEKATGDNELEGMAAKGMHHLLNILHDWKAKYHTNKEGDLMFQNSDTYSNVILTDNIIHVIEKHSRGFENIPNAITNPDEIWSYWGDDSQLIPIRNYILFGKTCYIVQTKNGKITDAFSVTKSASNNYRKGVLL
jgi:uncharacterized protein with gpF-like domain